jgi:hypothetical protein
MLVINLLPKLLQPRAVLFGQTLNRHIESQRVCPDVIIAFGTGYCVPFQSNLFSLKYILHIVQITWRKKKSLCQLPIKFPAQAKSHPQVSHFSIEPNFPRAFFFKLSL